MMRCEFRLTAFCLLLLASANAGAAIHEVTVGDNFFSPANLTIQQGDTVRWVNAAGGNPHNVTSNTGAWTASVTASSFTFEVTFDEPGVFNYLCTIHSAQMQGTITVEAVEEPFQINAGLNDAWFNPDTPGQGFFFNVFPNLQLMFIAWFTFDTERPGEEVTATLGEPGHRWVTGIGPYSGDTANIVLELTEGAVFDSADPPFMQTQDYGTLDITFQDCEFASVVYNIPAAGVSGNIDIKRIVADNIPLCQSLSAGEGPVR